MIVRAIIVDDELPNRENLQLMLGRHCKNVDVVALAGSAVEAMDVIREYRPDLVFLDIEMPNGSGFDLLESLSAINFEVIFVTAYDHYAIRAIKFCALDYLLKPLDILELKKATERVVEKLAKAKQNESMKVFMQNRHFTGQVKRIALPTSEKVDFVPVHEILRCQGESNYTHIHLRNGEKIMVSRTLKEYDELLSEYNFLRVHQSHLVNLEEVKSYVRRDGGYILMTDGSHVSVSKQKKELVLRRLSG